MTREPIKRLKTLVRRIEEWEEMNLEIDSPTTEELLLDIKECLESIILDPNMSEIME